MVPYRADSIVGVNDEQWVTGGVDDKDDSYDDWEMLLYFQI